MKVGIVVQRYGAEISGGAELHARYVAEHLARHVDVEVLTTCARDYVTWANEVPAGSETVNGILVRRFPVRRARDPEDFARQSVRVFDQAHSFADELAWLESEGPTSPALISYIRSGHDAFDYFIFFSFRYYHAFYGARAAASKAVLVPTAERDPAVGLSVFGPIFRGVRALMYNSFEERAMIRAVSSNDAVPGVVVGIGSEVPETNRPERFRRKFGIDARYLIYVGRIDENKGCRELFDFFSRYASRQTDVTLVVVGSALMPIPRHPRIRHLGYLSDEDKFDGIAGSELLLMPSYYESLSMVTLEAWALGRPVLANGRCDVLRGQCIRSNAGLYYEDGDEFVEALRLLTSDTGMSRALGENGREYFQRHYTWRVIEDKYLNMLDRLERENRQGRNDSPMPPLPGWFGRRRRNLSPGREVVSRLPAGPALPARQVADQIA